ncbi:unnamed protein product [Trichogramma brassicae]|uniref:Uncharacterized protein n=1 Tax=Trichogramma brassicae TaxID=86971 RepID=A0A6H5I8V7_9HYME|nr:unnamed protein product [Trichogramma brassicae]
MPELHSLRLADSTSDLLRAVPHEMIFPAAPTTDSLLPTVSHPVVKSKASKASRDPLIDLCVENFPTDHRIHAHVPHVRAENRALWCSFLDHPRDSRTVTRERDGSAIKVVAHELPDIPRAAPSRQFLHHRVPSEIIKCTDDVEKDAKGQGFLTSRHDGSCESNRIGSGSPGPEAKLPRRGVIFVRDHGEKAPSN